MANQVFGKRKMDQLSQNEDQESQKSKKLRVDADSLKVFNDPIHGHIELHPLCVQIIDTPQFQRLRHIKQLGCSYLVFPGAVHNRFEHSLGVCHLAGMLCRTLQKKQPELKIEEKDVLCVEIAGLCHDLGHGPFSHMFDQLFIPAVDPDSKWKHEKASLKMFDHLIEVNELKKVFLKYDLDDQDINFIKELIDRPKKQEDEHWPYTGRTQDKSFLYEIVANKRNSIDVDKWDYIMRDCHYLGISGSFDCHRIMKSCRVNKDNKGEKQICARDKVARNLYDMFHTRYNLHCRAYQHKVKNIIESMVVEALVKANDHFKVNGKEGLYRKMSEAIDDMVAYTNMTDDIILQIMRSDDPALAESRRILEMVQRRQLYKCVGQAQPPDETIIDRTKIPEMKTKIMGAQDADQLIINIVDLSYGKGPENPIDYVTFYSKADPKRVLPKDQLLVSKMLPRCFEEQHIHVYCKSPRNIEEASKRFEHWCDKNKYTVQLQAGNVLDSELTAEVSPTGMSTTDVDWSKDQGTPKKNHTANPQPRPPVKERK